VRLLIDGTPLLTGGSLQAAIAFVLNVCSRPDIAWLAAFPASTVDMLPPDIVADPRMRFFPKAGKFDMLRLRGQLAALEREHSPGLTFTVFGPAYFRARSFHLVGFARPRLIYKPEDYFGRPTIGSRLAEAGWAHLFKRSDHFVVETTTARRRLASRLGICETVIDVIPNGVNPLLSTIKTTPRDPTGPARILVPAAAYPHKNLDVIPAVARALCQLVPTIDFEFRLTLPPESTAWQTLAATARNLGVADRLKAIGNLALPKLGSAYLDASLVFLPTLLEVSTAVYPESFHFERPLVTSDLDFARDLCGEAALFVPPRDPEEIARRIYWLLQSPAKQASIVASGKTQLMSNYATPERKFGMQIDLLRRCLEVKSGKREWHSIS